MNCIWLTGGNGFLGTEFYRILIGKFPGSKILRIIHLSEPANDSSSLRNIERLDLTDFHLVGKIFEVYPPDAIFHLAAASDANWCEANPGESSKINVEATVRLGELCAGKRIPLIFSSTDLIFDGKTGNYSESSIPGPLSLYGKQKVQAEIETRRIHPDGFTVCRIPLMFGPPGISGKNPQWGLIQAFLEDKPVKLFTDEYRSTASTSRVSEGLLLALKERPPVIHVGGRERISRFEFGIRLARWLGMPTDKITPGLQSEVPMAAARPSDVSLNSDMAFSLGYSPGSLEEEWESIPFFRNLRNLREKL